MKYRNGLRSNFFVFFILTFSFFAISTGSFADVVKTTDTIYQDAETNGIAVAICKAIDIGKIFMVPLFAIMFCIMGFRAFQGDGAKWSVFMTFALGMAAFNSAGTILSWFMPKMGLEYGCKCAVERDIRDVNGVVETQPTGLNYDCSYGITDYYNLHNINGNANDTLLYEKRKELKKLQKIVAQYENLLEDLNELEVLIKEKEADISLLDGKISAQQAIITSYAQSDVLNTYDVYKNIFKEKQSALKAKEADMSGYEKEVISAEKRITDVKNKIKSQQKVINVMTENYNKALNSLNEYKKQKDNSPGVIEALTNVVSSAKTSLEEAKNSLKTYESELKTLQSTKSEKQKALEEERKKYNEVKKAYNIALNDVKNFEQRVEMKVYAQAQETKESLTQQYNAKQKELANLTTKKQIKENEITKLSDSYTDAAAKVPALQIEIEQIASIG